MSDAELLAAFAAQTAVALENASLGRQLEQAFQASVASLIVTLEAKHKYTEGHSMRVAEYAQGISVTLGLSVLAHEQVRTAALLHDLGKVGIRDEVLDKPGDLTAAEWAAMREHPQLGARILGSLGFLTEEARIVRHHHERLDGSGYPDGLTGEAIPLAARIIGVADAFDAMRSARSYRRELSETAAIDELRRGAGTQFDPDAVEAFCAWRAAHPAHPATTDPAPPSAMALGTEPL
jgi:putative nucleotidyltransferase with HDIG domain